MTSSTRPLPYPSAKLARRPFHTHTHSIASSVSSRRTSLPALHLHSITTRATTLASAAPPQIMTDNTENIMTIHDYDTYSSLSSYTFGAASASPRPPHDSDMLSPLTVLPDPEGSEVSVDRTPRPSIFHPNNDADDDDDEEVFRRNRAKMRAIDDGQRRPSLPTNIYSSTRPSDGSVIGLVGPSNRRHGPGSAADVDTQSNPRKKIFDADPDTGHESGALDTDVEFEQLASDNAFQHTFRPDAQHSRANQQLRTRVPWDLSSDSESDADHQFDSYTVDPSERGQYGASPVTFAHTLRSDEDESLSGASDQVVSLSVVADGRRPSLPMAIPGRSPPAGAPTFEHADAGGLREREGSIVTLRRPSRSLDDDLRTVNAGMSGPVALATSEPMSRADWRAFENEFDARQEQASGTGDAYEGLNLDYILSAGAMGIPGSRRSSNSFMMPLPVSPSKGKGKEKRKDKDKGKGKEKRKGKEREDADALGFGQWASAAGPASASAVAEIAPWAVEAGQGRRPSTVTLGDDTFTGHVKKFDAGYNLRKAEWSFVHELSTGPPLHSASMRRDDDGGSGSPIMQEIWRCAQIGRMRLDRLSVLTSDPNKLPQQRLNVQHIVDTLSRNTLGGPSSIIHKHSKAAAFSIFRHHGLLDPRPPGVPRSEGSTQGPHGSLPTSNSILLAPKRVQVQYTSTKSTKLLSTHGLLDEREATRGQNKERGSESRKSTPDPPPLSSTSSSTHSGQQILSRSGASGKTTRPSTASSTAGSQIPSVSGHSSFDITPSIATVHQSNPPQTSGTRTTASTTPSHTSDSDSDSDDSGPQIVRTSHAEAFATLDRVSLEQYRSRHPPSPDSPPGVTGWLRRRMRGPSSSAIRSPQANFNPPWMTLAPRATQEQQERVIQGLNESFKDVGLLPSYRKKGGAGIGRKGHSKNGDVLTHVPDDSLYMLLPLWPRETDPVSASKEKVEGRTYLPPVDDRLYLLVYYVPFERDKRGAAKSEGFSSKKRSRSVSRRGEHGHPQSDSGRSIVLSSFRVIARLVAYADLRGSGVRLPSRGLSVAGDMTLAVQGIPSANLRDVHQDDFVIAVCLKREKGIDFVPEGLEKLGLCEPRVQPTFYGGALGTADPAMQVRDPDPDWEAMNAEPQALTAIGRAAVEMVWLGCMALTSFRGF
ncbi:hypothetical protein EW146_g5439 [Bondarzewia mesenterica]|uniref:Uncharacterized protein n=1 Tax=Bondarzewia mesenterica TaxID=1095465 RepID=A0A4S4LRJ0_9AGAM|nr:hypothetical protein EW146_g5439 [Bondarzewia mesenterica]